MAIIKCYECGGKVSTSAAACPHCGAPPKQQTPAADTNSFIKDSAVLAENRDNIRDVERTLGTHDKDLNPSKVKRNIILASSLVVAFFVVVILISRSNHGSPDTVSLINSEGDTFSCPANNGESCMREAERKGFVKLSDALAGIKFDANTRPLRILDVRGTAAEAGVRKGDILLELDGNKITEVLSVFRIMSEKQPGDQLTVTVLREDRPLVFVYNVMQRRSRSDGPSV
jgi:hypothetical protein